jgi:hypothetical protein
VPVLNEHDEEAMTMFDKLKKIADQAKEKAGPLAEQAAHRATELAADAREKAGPLAEQAKGRATEMASKAAPAVSQGVGKAAGSIDKATKGRFTEHIDKVHGVVNDTAQKVSKAGSGNPAGPGAATTVPGAEAAPVVDAAGASGTPISQPVGGAADGMPVESLGVPAEGFGVPADSLGVPSGGLDIPAEPVSQHPTEAEKLSKAAEDPQLGL